MKTIREVHLHNTAIIIREGPGCENSQGVHYDTAIIICKGGVKNSQGGTVYDTCTAMIIIRWCENSQGVHYMTLQ